MRIFRCCVLIGWWKRLVETMPWKIPHGICISQIHHQMSESRAQHVNHNFGGNELERFVNLIASFIPVFVPLHQQHAVNPLHLLLNAIIAHTHTAHTHSPYWLGAHTIAVHSAQQHNESLVQTKKKLEIATKIIIYNIYMGICTIYVHSMALYTENRMSHR